MFNLISSKILEVKSLFKSNNDEELNLVKNLKEFVIAKEIYDDIDLSDDVGVKNCYIYISRLKLNLIEDLFSTLSISNKKHFNSMIRELGEIQDSLLKHNARLEFSDHDEIKRMNDYIRKYSTYNR